MARLPAMVEGPAQSIISSPMLGCCRDHRQLSSTMSSERVIGGKPLLFRMRHSLMEESASLLPFLPCRHLYHNTELFKRCLRSSVRVSVDV
jgi:hypothetical protein